MQFWWVGDIDPTVRDYLGPEIARAEATGSFQLAGWQQMCSGSMPPICSSGLARGPLSQGRAGGAGAACPSSPSRIPVAFRACFRASAWARSRPPGRAGDGARGGAAAAPSAAGRRARHMVELIADKFAFLDYVRDLVRLALPSLPTISVAVPNYNYAHCLPERLYTIFDQNRPVEEVIVLDDCSTDDSIPVI